MLIGGGFFETSIFIIGKRSALYWLVDIMFQQ